MVHSVDATERTNRRRQAQTERFLLAARGIVTREGIDALTVPRLAAELDCAVGGLYRYFPSKAALLAELQREAAEEITERFRALRAIVDGRMPELGVRDERAAAALRLVCLGDYILAAATVLPEQLRLLHLLVSDPRGIIPDSEAYRAEPATIALFAEVFGLFEAAADAGAIDVGVAATRTIVWLASLQQIVQTGKLARFDAELFDTTVLARETARALLSGWGADAALLARCRGWADAIDVVALTATVAGPSARR